MKRVGTSSCILKAVLAMFAATITTVGSRQLGLNLIADGDDGRQNFVGRIAERIGKSVGLIQRLRGWRVRDR